MSNATRNLNPILKHMLGLDIAYWCTKFDHSSFSRSRIWLISTKILMVHVTWPRPFHEWFLMLKLRLATVNLPTKCEVSLSAHYEDMKMDKKI